MTTKTTNAVTARLASTAFDGSGFDPVDAFFRTNHNSLANTRRRQNANSTATTETGKSDSTITTITATTTSNSRRRGVGSLAVPSSRSGSSSTLPRYGSILSLSQQSRQVGLITTDHHAKRKRHGIMKAKDDDDNDDGHDNKKDSHSNHPLVDDDDELGRTKLMDHKANDPVPHLANQEVIKAHRSTTNKKKTKGKKERMAERTLAGDETKTNADAVNNALDADAEPDIQPSDLADKSSMNQPRKSSTTDNNQQQQENHEVGASSQRRGHRRKKVRSRQKNIYKDHRSQKPEHLMLGQPQYQGLPLTAETRSKMGLGPSSTLVRKHQILEQQYENVGMTLVDDDDNDNNPHPTTRQDRSSSPQTAEMPIDNDEAIPKAKRSRFKNLR